jgi:adenylate cyclase class 2
MLEVEVKAQCRAMEGRLRDLGAKKIQEEEQHDTYFTSPLRDFRVTDEALRVRRAGGKYVLTYKGPKFDSETKAREELESSVGAEIFDVLDRLGFRKAAVVEKKRKTYSLRGLCVCLDCVGGLGEFIEIEAKDSSKKADIFRLLEDLGLRKEDTTRKSYLELLEEKGLI